MDLSKFQQILARLYTDHSFRERFFSSPCATGAELGLSTEELEQLARLSRAQVSFFAASLVRKRLNEVRKLLPLSSQVLGQTFNALFWRYAQTHTLKAQKPHQRDAVAFSRFVVEEARLKKLDPPWSVDVARYEAARVEVLALRRRWAVRRFHYPLAKLLRSILRVNGEPIPAPQPSLALWIRLSRQGRVWHFVLSIPHLRWRKGFEYSSSNMFES